MSGLYSSPRAPMVVDTENELRAHRLGEWTRLSSDSLQFSKMVKISESRARHPEPGFTTCTVAVEARQTP